MYHDDSSPESLLVVGPGPPHKYSDVVLAQLDLILLERLDDALEGGGNVREVGDTAAHDEDLPLRMALLRHEGEERPRVVVGLLLGRRPGILTVVGQLWGKMSNSAERR